MTADSILESRPFRVGVFDYAEGFLLGVFYEMMPVHFRMQGIDLSEIGFLSLLLSLTWSVM
jgi:hypothetical protein